MVHRQEDIFPRTIMLTHFLTPIPHTLFGHLFRCPLLLPALHPLSPVQSVLEVPAGDKLSLLACKGAGVHLERHAHSWLLHLDGGQGNGVIPGSNGLANLQGRDGMGRD